MTIPPVRRSIVVPWPPEAAFRRFTQEIGTWWPSRTHSVGGKVVKAVVFEGRLGGRIYEEHTDGRRFQWGEVTVWEPPARVRFTWHPSRSPDTAQDVELTFRAEGPGTRLELVHTGWENLGALGPKAAKGYGIGWRYVLDVWAGRRGGFVRTMDVLAAVIGGAQRLRRPAGDPRDRMGGEIERVS
ncbi:MAG: SRPBCC domain-containing protein [Gemmatimonadales bacterium]